jgi:hypothetical protein
MTSQCDVSGDSDKAYSGGHHILLVGGGTCISKCDKAPEEVVIAMKTISDEKTQRDHDKKES